MSDQTTTLTLDLEAASDAALVDEVAHAVAQAKEGAADSFLLHAPLEVLARDALLAALAPGGREAARRRLALVAVEYTRAGAPASPPAPRAFDSPSDGLARLRAALAAGKLDDADAAAAWLAEVLTPTELARALADEVLPRLAAAAHGSIFLYLLPRVAPRSRAAARMVRGLVRELAREPSWRLSWHLAVERQHARLSRDHDPARAEEALFEALRRPPSPGTPESLFIYPTMSLVEKSGLAASLLDAPTRALDVRQATRVLLRIAALSMLQDSTEHAAYGWSHCLTLPQAALGIAGGLAVPADAVAVAATYVLGFRSIVGSVSLERDWSPEPLPPERDRIEALTASPADAASALWHARREELPSLVAHVVASAAAHEDAHLAKYTLACLDAAADDPAAARLYLAAAAFLAAWWATEGAA